MTMTTLPGKLFDCFTIRFPEEKRFVALHGRNGSYKTHTLAFLADYWRSKGEHVLYFPEERWFTVTKEDVERARSVAEVPVRLRNLVGSTRSKKDAFGLFDEFIDWDAIPYPTGERITSGTPQLTNLLTRVVLAPPGAVVLIDEPERHLHMMVSMKLVSALLQQPLKRLVVATHSPDIVQSRSEALTKIEDICMITPSSSV